MLIFLMYGRDASAHPTDFDAGQVAALPEDAGLPSADEAEREALAVRRDLIAPRLQVDQSRIQVEVSENSLRPSPHFTGEYKAVSSADAIRVLGVGAANDYASVGWTTGLLMTLPMRNDSAKAAYQQAALAADQATIGVASMENQVRAEVRQAVRAIRAGRERIDVATQTLTLARAEYDAEDERLRLGLSDAFRLLQVEEKIAQAQSVQLQVRFSLAQALVSYDLVRGYLTETDNVTGFH